MPQLTGAYIRAGEFAALAGISERKSRQAMADATKGKPWRGQELDVLTIGGGRGGKRGLSYMVRLDSLPAELQAAYAAQSGMAGGSAGVPAVVSAPATAIAAGPAGGGEAGGAPLPAPPDGDGDGRPAVPAGIKNKRFKDWNWRIQAIAPAIEHPRGSRERAAEIAAIARRGITGRDGRPVQVTEQTLRHWIRAYEEHGLAGLVRRERQDAGLRKVIVSKKWDRMADAKNIPEEVRHSVAANLHKRIRTLWKKGANSRRKIAKMATTRLIELTRKEIPDLSDAELKKACKVSEYLAHQYQGNRIVAISKNDAKQNDDKHKPRTHRSKDGMVPMEVVVGDVHPVDVLVTRSDSTVCTPRLIAWQDVATNRIFATLYILPAGTGIRQEHIAESFVAMVRHPHWGLPQHLYIDNGGEYGRLHVIEDAMRLVYRADKITPRSDGRPSMIVHTQPYNAAAKPIEGLFAALEKIFQFLPGWIGGDRTKKKTANVGRPPAPFKGDEAKLQHDFQAALDFYHVMEQRGSLRGRSPNQAFEAFVRAGWERVDVDADALGFGFSRVERRKIRQGEIPIEGKYYRHDALLARSGETVTVRIPRIDACGDFVYVFRGQGEGEEDLLCVADAAPSSRYLDSEGAKDQKKREKALKLQLNAMDADTEEDVDLVEEAKKTAARHPAPPTPASAGTISVHGGWAAAAAAKQTLSAPADDEDFDALADAEEAAFRRRSEGRRLVTRRAG